MGAAAILTLLLPYLPNVLEFLSVQLARVLVKQSPNVPPKTNDEVIFEIVRLVVDGIDDAHEDWPNEDRHRFALDAIRANLKTEHNLSLSDLEINLLIELYVVRKRAAALKGSVA